MNRNESQMRHAKNSSGPKSTKTNSARTGERKSPKKSGTPSSNKARKKSLPKKKPKSKFQIFLCWTGVTAMSMVGGILAWMAFPGVSWWWCIFPSLVLLILAVRDRSVPLAGWAGLIWGLTFMLPHTYWSFVSVGDWQPWVLLACIQGLSVGLWGMVMAGMQRWWWLRPWPVWGVFAVLLWSGCEQIRSHFPFGGFPWGLVAYSQVDSPIGRLAPYLGEVGVSAITTLVSVSLAAIVAKEIHMPARLGTFVLAIFIFVCPIFVKLPLDLKAGEKPEVVRIAGIQGDVSYPPEESFSRYLEVTNNHVTETENMLQSQRKNPPELILWGENAADMDPRSDKGAHLEIEEVLAKAQVPMVIGVVRYENDYRYNEVLPFYPDGSIGVAYTKQRPVAFGEYIPYRAILQKLSPKLDQISVDMLPGKRPTFIDVKLDDDRTIRLISPICFEISIDSVVRQGVRAGGTIIYVPTNNGSFGYTAESEQQLQITRFRALEYSRSAVQVSTQGVSGVVTPDGKIKEQTGLFTGTYTISDLPLNSVQTWAAKTGEWPAYLSMGLVGIMGLIAILGRLIMGPKKRF